eukprot:2050492-Prymnesium_polylepis.2
MQVSWWYHMYGSNTGSLHLLSTDWVEVWSLAGDQGDTWHRATATVQGSSFTFEAVRGGGYRGDMAVDEVEVTCVGSPQPPPPPQGPAPPPRPPAPPPLPPLSAGDCMIIGLNSDSPDDFAILLLAPLGPGQSISATDDGWRTDVTPNAFRGFQYDSHVTHTASTDEPAGTSRHSADKCPLCGTTFIWRVF